MGHVFDAIAGEYDRWYDTPEGDALFRAERDCLLSLHGGPFGSWLEAGAGTGRFASALGIPVCADPSPEMLAIAAKRGLETLRCVAESLPFGTGSFGGTLLAFSLAFTADAGLALGECRRVLRPGGFLLVGEVTANGEWGRAYKKKAAGGHPVYALARFRTAEETLALAERAGFRLTQAACTLFWGPDEAPETPPRIEAGIHPQAGFQALLFRSLRNCGPAVI